MLRAVGVYDLSQDQDKFNRIEEKCAQKPGTLFFANNSLNDLERIVLPTLIKQMKQPAGKCELMAVSDLPQPNQLSAFPLRFNAAYIRCGGGLYYLNQKPIKKKDDQPEPYLEQIQLEPETLAEFDATFQPNSDAQDLSELQMTNISILTRHAHDRQTMYADAVGEERYYAEWIPETNHLLVAMSERLLEKKEARMVLVNMNHIDNGRIKYTFMDMVRNPVGFTGRDLLTQKLLDETAELKVIGLNSLAIVQERGERTKTLEQKTDHLFIASEELKEGAEEVRDSQTCGGCFSRAVKKVGLNNAIRIIR